MRRGWTAAQLADALEAVAVEVRGAVGGGSGAERVLELYEWLPLVRDALARRGPSRTHLIRQRALVAEMRRRGAERAA